MTIRNGRRKKRRGTKRPSAALKKLRAQASASKSMRKTKTPRKPRKKR
jgi:hypothetical protein